MSSRGRSSKDRGRRGWQAKSLLPRMGGSGRGGVKGLLDALRSSGEEVSPSEPKGGEGVGKKRKSEIDSPQVRMSGRAPGAIWV